MDIYTSINIHCVVAESSSIESLWLDSERSRASAATLAESEFVSSESLDDKAISDGSWGGAGRLVTCSVVVNNFAVLMPSFDVDESDGASLFCWQVALKVVRLQGPHGRSRLVSTSTSPLIPVKMTPQHTVFLWNKQNIWNKCLSGSTSQPQRIIIIQNLNAVPSHSKFLKCIMEFPGISV